MAFDMMNSSSSVVANLRPDYDLPNQGTTTSTVPFSSFKNAYSFSNRPPSSLTLAEQAELEYELRYRGNMIVDQQRKIQQLEEELRQARDQVDMMNSQLSSYEQERGKEKKKPQSRYWTPEEHQRFLEALQKYGHKDVKSISLHVATRNATQVRTHAQKYFLRLERERRKKEEISNNDEYNSSSELDDGSPEQSNDDGGSSVSISSLTLPGSPAVSMMSDVVGTPPGTPGDSTPGGPSSPTGAFSSSPIPRRRRATSFITVAQARLAAQARDSVLVGLPPTWVVEDYDLFMKGLLALADKQEDVGSLCRAIREQYLPHHTPDEVEMCYRNVLKNIKQKPIVGSPKRRRTNSRPEPLTAPLNAAVAFAPTTFLVPSSAGSLGSTFPFQRGGNGGGNSHSHHSSFGSSPPSHPSSPLTQSHGSPAVMRGSPYGNSSAEPYGSLSSAPLELPILSDLNISGLSPIMSANMAAAQAQHQAHVQNQQAQSQQNNQQGAQGFSPLSPSPITPSSLWGSALPFSFDALMSGNVALPQADRKSVV